METEEYEQELASVRGRYPQIDYIFLKDYFGRAVVSPSFGT